MTSSHLDRRFGRKIQVPLFASHRFQITDTAIGKDD
jgi:hypothetical protein